jgi:putative FmdB family regulatory protein
MGAMPLYEYVCGACKHTIELLIRGDQAPVCPDCGSKSLDRQWSVPAAHTGGSSLPVCQTPAPGGGCGAPWCGQGGCES